jgi:hypothetical protein
MLFGTSCQSLDLFHNLALISHVTTEALCNTTFVCLNCPNNEHQWIQFHHQEPSKHIHLVCKTMDDIYRTWWFWRVTCILDISIWDKEAVNSIDKRQVSQIPDEKGRMAPVLRRETDDAVVDGGDGGEIKGVSGGRILICHVRLSTSYLQSLREMCGLLLLCGWFGRCRTKRQPCAYNRDVTDLISFWSWSVDGRLPSCDG